MQANVEAVVQKRRIAAMLSQKKSEQRLIRYFANTNLGNGHKGLSEIALKEDVDVNNLTRGEYVIFTNTRKNAVKMFAPGGVIAHFKVPGGARLDLRTIASLPKFFNGSEIRYSEALKHTIEKSLASKA